MKNSTNRFGGAIINWVKIFVQIIISLFFIPFFLNKVGDKAYGLYSFSTSLIAWLDTFMIAVAAAYYKFLTREKKRYGETGEARACGIFFKIFIAISIIVLVVGLSFDALLYTNVIPLNQYSTVEKDQICIIILMSLISTAISCSLTAYKSYNFYKQKFVLVYSFSLGQIIVQTVLSVIFLKLNLGVVAVAAAHFSTALASSLLLSLFSKVFLKEKATMRATTPEDKAISKELLKEILIFSAFVIMNTVVDTLNKNLDKTILGFRNADSVATYQLAYTIPAYMMAFTSIISVVYEQKLNNAYYNGGGVGEMNLIFLKVSKIQTIFCLLIVGGYIACGKEFVYLWLDESRTQVYVIACVFMIIYSLTCSNGLAIAARRVQNLHIKASIIYIGIALFNIVLSVLLIMIFDIENAIWACVFGTAITYIIGNWIIFQIYDSKVTKLDIKNFTKTFFKYLFIALTIDVVCIRFIDMLKPSTTILSFFLKGGMFAVIFTVITCLNEAELFNQFKNKLVSIIKRKKTIKNLE